MPACRQPRPPQAACPTERRARGGLCLLTNPWLGNNRSRHDYDNVAEDQVWLTVNESLATLINIIEHELGGPTGDRT